MASVTFPIGLGGDGSTVTDDSNATTGLGNGGHRARFVPALYNTVAMANTAATSATTASTQASNASSSASAASTSATNANNSFLSIDTKYLGSKTGDPSVNNQGGALATGATYWNSSTNTMRVYTGSSWVNSSSLVDFATNTFRVSDNTDSTKKLAFDTSGITTGTVRTLTVPNVSGTIAVLDSPTFTGVPAAPTATAGTSTTQLATTAFVTTADNLKAPLASPTFTGTVTAPNLAFNTNGGRITGDFTTTTFANRVMFQTSTTNGATSIGVLPNGTSAISNLSLFGGTDPSNCSWLQLVNNTSSAYCGLNSFKLGTGVTLPIQFQIDSSAALTIDTSRNSTFTGTVTTPTITTTGPTGLSLTNGTSNLISFSSGGGAPTFTTRSAGTKISLAAGGPTPSITEHAIGIESSTTWFSTPSTSHFFKWYGGTTVAATLTGAGDLTTTGTVSGSSATGFRNKIINGDFQVWQAGTSFTNPTSNATAYCADQWQFIRIGYAAGITATQQQTQTASKGIRIQRTAGDTSVSAITLSSVHETIDVVKFAGKTVTFQFKAKCGANFSSSSSILSTGVFYGTGSDSTINTGFTGQGTVTISNITVSTTLAQLSLTCTIPSNASQLCIQFYYYPTGTAGANDWFEITDVQLEEGSVSTPFERRPYGLELSLCQRYYYRAYNFIGFATTSTSCQITLAYPSMRTAPTINAPVQNNIIDGSANFNQSAASFSVISSSLIGAVVQLNNYTGLTAFRPVIANNSTGYIEFSARL